VLRQQLVASRPHNGPVVLAIPTSTALRGTSDLRQLVEAVVKAGTHDEADWIEWKGPLDLTAKAGCCTVARTILGMANRDPERARVICEGLGYVVIGAEPGTVHGLSSVDHATLDQLIERTSAAPRGQPGHPRTSPSTAIPSSS